MRKLLFLIFLSLFFFLPARVLAQEVESTMEVSYDISTAGITEANFTIQVENLVTEKYTSHFNFVLQGVHPENVHAFDGDTALIVSIEEIDGAKSINVSFPEPLVGKGKQREFTVSFLDKTLVEKAGEVWEVTLPQIKNTDSFASFRSEMRVPLSFGNLAYISPTPVEEYKDGSKYFYVFDSQSYKAGAISAAFGEFQVFSFNLIYHLENPITKPTTVEIAIPPDTNFQKVIYQSISPKPSDMRTDEDGNWLAMYSLNTRQKMEVTVSGFVQIYATPRHLNTQESALESYTIAQKYWESDDPLIKNAAEGLNTPHDIYQYVVNALSYSYDRAKPNVIRVGAKQALLSPKEAICMEFTDLFIALARAKGIPAREVNGYAYAENSTTQPLSLVADVLHAWPEYWDNERKNWIPVDPTWADTTNLDYFSKLDLRHFTFVIHGKDSEKPYPPGSYKLGANPQKDVYVSFAKLPEKRLPKLTAAISPPKGMSFNATSHKGVILNDGPVAIYDQEVKVVFDGKQVGSYPVPVLFPFQRKEIPIDFSYGFFGERAPDKIEIHAGDASSSLNIDKSKIIMERLAVIFLVLFSAVSVLFLKILKK